MGAIFFSCKRRERATCHPFFSVSAEPGAWSGSMPMLWVWIVFTGHDLCRQSSTDVAFSPGEVKTDSHAWTQHRCGSDGLQEDVEERFTNYWTTSR